MTLRLIDTFSGIGGFSYAAETLVGGFKTVAFVECEPFCQKVLKKHWPHVEQFHDIRTYQPEPYSADVICGGFPCQDLSVAGRGEGIKKDTRSGLWYELYRVICLLQPRYVVLENVSAILSRGLGIVLGNLAEARYNCEWCCIPATYIGACHQRDRWYLIAYNQSERTGEYKSRLRGQSKGRDLQTDRDTNQKISSSSNSECDRLQGEVGARIHSTTWKTQNIRFLNPNWRQYLSQPTIRRGDDGVPRWVDRTKRLKALGNSVVPQVAAIPLQRVLDLEKLTASA